MKTEMCWGGRPPTSNYGSDLECEEVQKGDVFLREPEILEIVNNRIYFYSEVNRENVLRLNKELRMMSDNHLYESFLSGEIGEVRTKPIFLHIQSFGGSIFAGLAGMDQVLESKAPVYTIIDGCCASAATFISIAGGKRYMNRHSFMMIHQLTNGMWGKYEEFKDEMSNMDRIMTTIKDIYNKYTKVPNEKLEEILKHDIWFTPEECLEYGLVDEILGS